MRHILTILFSFAVLSLTAQQGYAPPVETKRDGSAVTVGTVFRPFEPVMADGVTFYRFSSWGGPTRAGIWDAATGTLIAEGIAPAGATGWVTVELSPRVMLNDGDYVVGYSNADGWYSFTPGYFPRTFSNFEASTGRYVYQDFRFPNLSFQLSSYSVFPVLSEISAPIPCDPVVIRDTIVIRDTVVDVIYMDGKDTLFVDRNSNYTDSALQTWPFQGIWNYEFRTGAERFRFVRAFVWRREKWDGQAWRAED